MTNNAYFNGKPIGGYINFDMPKLSSHIELVDGTIIEFNPDNTPFDNSHFQENITINGIDYGSEYNNIKGIVFNDDYNYVTSITFSFLWQNYDLEYVDLRGLKNVTSIMGRFINYCKNLSVLDISMFTKLTNIGSDFLYGAHINCEKCLKDIYIGNLDFSNINTAYAFMYSSFNDSSHKIHTTTQQLGNNFKAKAYNNCISNWSVVVE